MIKFTEKEWSEFKAITEKNVHSLVDQSRGVKAPGERERLSLRIGDRYTNDIDAVITRAQLRTFESMSDDEIAFDGYKIIMFQAWRDHQARECGVNVDPLGSYDMKVGEHVFELQERKNVSLWKWLYSQVERYENGLVDPSEAELFKDYELYIVE